jgi:hypothetical protein
MSAINKIMDLNKAARHFFSIEMTNEERLETAALMDSVREHGFSASKYKPWSLY